MSGISNARQLGVAVRVERKRRELSQAALAERSGVSRAWLVRFEAGHPSASIEPVFRVLNALGVAIAFTEPRASDAENAVLAALAARSSGK